MDDPIVLHTEFYGPPWDCPFCNRRDIPPEWAECPACGKKESEYPWDEYYINTSGEIYGPVPY